MKLVDQRLSEFLPPLNRWENALLKEGEVLIIAPGFEDRTFGLARAVLSAPNVSAILLDYRPAQFNNQLSAVREALATRDIRVNEPDIIQYDRFDPGDFEDRLSSRLMALGARNALVDASTMSKLEIMLVLNVCLTLKLGVRVCYCEAASYGPSQEEFQSAKDNNKIHQPSLQIFTGVHGVIRVDSLSSVAMQGQPTAALVFMSFNDVLTQVLLNTVYPSRLMLINGRPPEHQWREEATAWIHDQVRREWEEDNPLKHVNGESTMPSRSVSTLLYTETVSLVLSLYWQLSTSHRILLAPSGSKMQAIGSFLVRALHPDIHIEYPSPEGFLRNYSVGIGNRWLIDFGLLTELIDGLGAIEQDYFIKIPQHQDLAQTSSQAEVELS